MATNISTSINWDMNNKHVQSTIQDNGVAVQARSILLAAGAPKLENATTRPGALGSFLNILNPAYSNNFGDSLDIAYPIGTVENIAIGQNKQLQQFFEIGSNLRYFIPGRTVNSMSLSRTYLDGPSLLKVLYAFYRNPDDLDSGDFTLPVDRNTGNPMTINANNLPGYNSMWLNIASQLFDLPFGLLMYVQDNRENDKGAVYFENCYVASHNFGINSSSTIFSESVNIQFDRIKPVNLQIG